jgi:transcriptional/translational regulatory protein YebC/TACO1
VSYGFLKVWTNLLCNSHPETASQLREYFQKWKATLANDFVVFIFESMDEIVVHSWGVNVPQFR